MLNSKIGLGSADLQVSWWFLQVHGTTGTPVHFSARTPDGWLSCEKLQRAELPWQSFDQ